MSTQIEGIDESIVGPYAPAIQIAKEILIVDPDVTATLDAHNVLRRLGRLHACDDFSSARERLRTHPPDLLVTNMRLRDHNGLHLVHLAKPRTRCIVYSTHDDLVLAREAQAAGAFYERWARLSGALPGYVIGSLPSTDRRDVALTDRRQFPRGGRRSSDV